MGTWQEIDKARTAHRLARARRIVAAQETELTRKLSDSERRALLDRNTTYDAKCIAALVDAMREQPQSAIPRS